MRRDATRRAAARGRQRGIANQNGRGGGPADEPTAATLVKASLHTKLDQLALRLAELDATLAAPDAARDLDRYRALTKEHAEIAPVVARFQ